MPVITLKAKRCYIVLKMTSVYFTETIFYPNRIKSECRILEIEFFAEKAVCFLRFKTKTYMRV